MVCSFVSYTCGSATSRRGWVYTCNSRNVCFFLFLALISFLYAVPRFWDIVVDGDDITIIKFFIFTKKTAFSEITKVEIAKNNYLKIYKNGREKAFFLIDPMMNGKNNFLKRIEKENILLIDNRKFDGNVVEEDEQEE